MELSLSRVVLATCAACLIYSAVTRERRRAGISIEASFGTHLYASVLGAIVFAWLVAPLSSVASDDLSLQIVIRGSGLAACTIPVLLVYYGYRLLRGRRP